jgi:beta-N-acetylhexosaminidase
VKRVHAHLDAGCDLVLACFPDVVDEAIAALPPLPRRMQRVATLRGAIGATWAGFLDNPQRDRFVARITALDPKESHEPLSTAWPMRCCAPISCCTIANNWTP